MNLPTSRSHLTAAESVALDRVIVGLGPNVIVGEFQPHRSSLLDDADALLDEPPEGMAGRLFDGLEFADAAANAGPAIWGTEEQAAWVPGEPVMIYGPQGAGKSTLAKRLLLARAGVTSSLLGLPVRPADAPILYVAADRPLQLARSWQRMVTGLTEEQRGLARDRIRFWKGPLGFDIATEPERLLRLMVNVGAKTLIADSLKDLAVDLTKDEVGGRVNRAWQTLIAAGIEVVDLHHPRKASAGTEGKPKSIDDVYGSTWLTTGHGSVLLLWGRPGDPIIELSQIKQPMEEVGPMRLIIDHELGTVEVHEGGDLLAILRSTGTPLGARDVARVLFSSSSPTDSEIEKARRKLERLRQRGLAVVVEPAGRDERGRVRPVTYAAAAAESEPS